MKRLQLFSIAFTGIFLIIMSACAPKKNGEAAFEKVQHFRHLQFTESPWDSIKGIYKISTTDAASVNNYTLKYDDSLRLVEVTYGRGDTLFENSSFGAAKMLINYEGNNEIRTYYDEKNQSKKVNGGVYKAVYSLDATGFRTGLKFYDENGAPIENRNKIGYYTWSRTADGMVKENRYTLAGEETVMNPFCPFYELRFTYDEKGRVVRMANFMADTLYDCTVENCGDIGVSYFEFKYNDQNGLLHFSVHSSTGQLSNLYWGWAKFTQVLNENGYVVERTRYDQDNELVGGKMIPIVAYTYDNSGSLLEEKNLNGEKMIINNPNDTIAIKQYKYNEYGRRIETVGFDKDGASKVL